MRRILTTPVASVYPHYGTKVERKGRTRAELDQVVRWPTGYDKATLQKHLATDTAFYEFFAEAQLNPNAASSTGVVYGVRVEDIDDPPTQKIRSWTRSSTSWPKASRWRKSARLVVVTASRGAMELRLRSRDRRPVLYAPVLAAREERARA